MLRKEQGPSDEAIERLKGMIETDKERLGGRLRWNHLVKDEERQPPQKGSRRSGKISEVFRAFEAE
jgi:hypothetical protein